MKKGPMDKDNREVGRIGCGMVCGLGRGEQWGQKGAPVIEQQ